MRGLKLVILTAFFSGQLLAQDQLAVRLNEKGIIKILQLALQYNSASKDSRSIIIPQNIYKFTLPKSQLHSNPIIPILNEISDLNMNRDLDFYLNTSDIKVNGKFDLKSIKTEITNSHARGFDLKLSLSLPEVTMGGARLSLCEDRIINSLNCADGLKATLSSLNISTISKSVHLSVVLRVKTDDKVGRVSVVSVNSNLDSADAPSLDINFKSLEVPKVAIVINGQETELDTSKLRDELLKRKSFLSKKLMGFAADFIANDLAEMINVYLINKEIATSYQVYRKDNFVKFDEFLTSEDFPLQHIYTPLPLNIQIQRYTDPMAAMMAQISEVIRSAQVDISLNKISTPGNKDIELSGLLNFVLNNKQINVRNMLGNTARPLPRLNMDGLRTNDLNLAISEPLINGALELANSTMLFQEIFEAISPVKGVYIRSIKLHFYGVNALVAVVNAKVDLNQLESKGVGSWFKNKIAAFLERNNNNGVIYFPIEVQVTPIFRQMTDGSTGLYLTVLSPFNYSELPNRFNYPTNVPDMTDTVKDGVMSELRDSLEPHTNKTYKIDVTKFLNQAGVIFQPRTISINQNAYLMLGLDLVDIKFNSKNPNQR